MREVKELLNKMFNDLCIESASLNDKIMNEDLTDIQMECCFDKLNELNIRTNQVYLICVEVEKELERSVSRETI